MLSFKAFLAFAVLATAVTALAIPRAAADVIAPAVTHPTAGTVWHVGALETVTWDTSSVPAWSENTGVLLLGFVEADDPSGNEHLDVDHPLAAGFRLADGAVKVTVPDVVPRDDYVVALIGDSGDVSGMFIIVP
ncbi:uncharacterized protein BXZ73DRAFT_103489 [Epithele typhae]|uniref:uncharacterized protein n=1 Tax=Epithele typhae TaxID=378194 RepID=UPI0020082C02|nr:uncharacterized protein BXZ73DRAFT_103489 [Epithele typhae]KAH9924651.1 hypothetical protein BXZ73DRAFT_103489 [Epithele typhae]